MNWSTEAIHPVPPSTIDHLSLGKRIGAPPQIMRITVSYIANLTTPTLIPPAPGPCAIPYGSRPLRCMLATRLRSCRAAQRLSQSARLNGRSSTHAGSITVTRPRFAARSASLIAHSIGPRGMNRAVLGKPIVVGAAACVEIFAVGGAHERESDAGVDDFARNAVEVLVFDALLRVPRTGPILLIAVTLGY